MKDFLYKTAYFLIKWCDDLNPIMIFVLIVVSALLSYFIGLWANVILFIIMWFIKKELSYVVLALSFLFGALNGR